MGSGGCDLAMSALVLAYRRMRRLELRPARPRPPPPPPPTTVGVLFSEGGSPPNDDGGRAGAEPSPPPRSAGSSRSSATASASRTRRRASAEPSPTPRCGARRACTSSAGGCSAGGRPGKVRAREPVRRTGVRTPQERRRAPRAGDRVERARRVRLRRHARGEALRPRSQGAAEASANGQYDLQRAIGLAEEIERSFGS